MQRHRKVKVEKDELAMIECNKCGKTCYLDDGNDFDIDLFHEFSTSFGFGSGFDMQGWSFDLCEDCLVELVKSFKTVPNGFNMDLTHPIIEDGSDQHQKLFDDWKKAGEWDDLKFLTYDELVDTSGFYGADYINKMIRKYHPDKPLLEDNE